MTTALYAAITRLAEWVYCAQDTAEMTYDRRSILPAATEPGANL